MKAPIHLRDCPCCRKPHGEDRGPQLLSENVVDLADTGKSYEIGFTVRCIDCGASVHDEYLSEAVRLWNGEPEPKDEDEGETE